MLWKEHVSSQWEARPLHQTPSPSWSLPTPLFSLTYFSISYYLSIHKRHSPAADTSPGTLKHPSQIIWVGWLTFWCPQAHITLCQQPGCSQGSPPHLADSPNLDLLTLPDQKSTQRFHPKPHGKSQWEDIQLMGSAES